MTKFIVERTKSVYYEAVIEIPDDTPEDDIREKIVQAVDALDDEQGTPKQNAFTEQDFDWEQRVQVKDGEGEVIAEW